MHALEQVLDNFVNGRRQPPANGAYARGDNSLCLPDSCVLDVQAAIAAAVRTAGHWLALGRPLRVRMLAQLAQRSVIEAEDPAAVATMLDAFRFPADGQLYTQSEQTVVPLSRSPAGIVKMLLPDGAHLGDCTVRLAALLATGNCLVIGVLHNPGSARAASSLRQLAHIGRHLPDGVLNVLYGRAATMGAALINAEQAVSKAVFRPPAVLRSVSARQMLN